MIKSVNKLTLQFNGFFSYFYAKYEDRMVKMLLPQHFTKELSALYPPTATHDFHDNGGIQNETTTKQAS